MRKYRAIIVRADGTEEEWGFYAFKEDHGALFIKSSEDPDLEYDHVLAAGTWREVQDIMADEEDDE